ncbi:MAG: DUF6152 family protein [Gammaproteobacteria bacterium]|nr:DUF6152 family protein [Gammaproteobacteria bacterium]
MNRFAITVFLAAGSAAQAHHSTAIYDSDNPIELAGTVVEWQFVNPHTIIVLEVAADDGETTVWSVEGSNTALLFRRGWTPNTLKPGDEIVVTVRPLHSGAPGGNYSNVRWADGTPVDPAANR